MRNQITQPPMSLHGTYAQDFTTEQLQIMIEGENELRKTQSERSRIVKESKKATKGFSPTPHLPSQQLVRSKDAETGSAGSASSRFEPSPPTVLRGAKLQSLTEVSIDWLRMSGPRTQLWEALRMLKKYYGPTEQGPGRFFLNTGQHWAEGGVFYDEDKTINRAHCLVELPGKMIAELEHHQVRQLMYDLATMGFKTVRCDIALDYFTEPNLINTINRSCLAGELCRAKTFQYIEQRNQNGLTGHGINIGKRGKMGSGRYLRVYDKGLETQSQNPGHWVRWEVELSDDCAQQFALDYMTKEDTVGTCINHALWVVEFREKTGFKSLSRRPLAEWYAKLTEETSPERIRAVRAKSTPESYTRWIRTSVLPKLVTIAAATRSTVGGVMKHLAPDVEPKLDHLQCPKVRTVSLSMGATAHQLHPNVRRGKAQCR